MLNLRIFFFFPSFLILEVATNGWFLIQVRSLQPTGRPCGCRNGY